MASKDKERNPHPELGSPVIRLDLEAQIALAEQAVIARQVRMRRRADALVVRVKRGAVRRAGGGLLVGIGAIALTWWLNRNTRHDAPPSQQAPAGAAPEAPSPFEHLLRDAGLTLAGILPVIWPVLPREFRRSVTPGMASSVLTFLAPLVARLFRRRRSAATSP